MLPSRLEADPRAVARASHAIRSRTSEEHWFDIASTEVDQIVTSPLPAPAQQLATLLAWLKSQAKDGHLAPVDTSDYEMLAAIVGAVDAQSFNRLLQWAQEQGFVEIDHQGKRVTLTPKAWTASPTDEREGKPAGPEKKSAFTRGQCPKCGPDRKAEITASHEEHWSERSASGTDTYNILKCAGCETIYVQHVNICSEDFDYEQDEAGEWTQVARPTITYWPAPICRGRPAWLDELEDESLRDVLREVYGALDADHRVLAAIGARTALDKAMVLNGATEAFGFFKKLTEMEEKQIISKHEKEILEVLTDAGSASAHRGWRPTPENLATIMDGTESFLNRTLIYGKAANAMRRDVPNRPKRPKVPKG